MAQNLSKRFALLCCSLMTMQALRLVISTAGFCVVRFHIDCELFNIFISRLVNAVYMAQLFGNWIGDLIVFAASGKQKLISAALANLVEFFCFCTALFSICHTEFGHLNGFYWSIVIAYFWWKVSEAPATSIAAPDATDYYFAGFTLSGVWAAFLKGLVMQCVADGSKPLHFQSDPLEEVNLSVVGARSVKTTVDYLAAKWLFVITIVLTFLMCFAWTLIAALVQEAVNQTPPGKKGVIKGKAENAAVAVFVGVAFGGVLAVPGAMLGAGVGWVFGKCCCLRQEKCQLIFGIVGALGGMAGGIAGLSGEWSQAELDWVVFFKWPGPVPEGTPEGEKSGKWVIALAALIGLGAGTASGAMVGLCIGACKGKKKAGFLAGAFIGSFLGLWTGEIANGCLTWRDTGTNKVGAVGADGGAKDYEEYVASCGVLIVVAGLGTVYSIYPGMAPCSITQFQYFNIIDIWILILSSIGPLVIMGVDLAEWEWRLGKVILGTDAGTDTQNQGKRRWTMGGAIVSAVLMTLATLICEIIVLDIMQHPHSKMAQQVTTSGWRACTLTILMVSFQLTSTGVGFGCVAAGSGFNDGVVNANSTVVLWTMECCGVLGEGYLTELKKYEPGKWPTQGMNKRESYKWWNRKAFGNAWQIWCCIGTTDLRRDIMLCRQ